jgi:hypothetical protein
MALWTDIITPPELTGYARAPGRLRGQPGHARPWLPNREVADIVVRFVAGSTGLVDVADFRAYDAEPTIGKGPSAASGSRSSCRRSGSNIPVSEYNQLRARNANPSDERCSRRSSTPPTSWSGRSPTRRAAARHRPQTGKATISNEGGFSMDDDFGRSGRSRP